MLIMGNWLLGSRNLIMPGNYLLAIMLEINNYLKFLSSGELSGMDYENFVIETIEIEVSYIF